MPLIKIREGLLEKDNYYLTSSFSDFLGDAICTRGEDYFKLKKGEIKRRFPYQECVIDIKKESQPMGEKDHFLFFVEVQNLATKNFRKIGLCEDKSLDTADYLRIISYEGFIQVYISYDGINFENIGGQSLDNEEVIYQGFEVKGETELIFTNYKIYRNSFLRIQNFDEGYIAELYTKEDELLMTREFDANRQSAFFLDTQIDGYVKVYNQAQQLLFVSELLHLERGDVYTFTSYEFEMSYEGNVIDYGPTYLDKETIVLKLKNIGDSSYHNLTLVVAQQSELEDIIEISFDNKVFEKSLFIESINQNEEIPIYVSIDRKNSNQFKVNDFEIQIY